VDKTERHPIYDELAATQPHADTPAGLDFQWAELELPVEPPPGAKRPPAKKKPATATAAPREKQPT